MATEVKPKGRLSNRLLFAVAAASALAVAPPPRSAAETPKAGETKEEYVTKAHLELDELGVKIDALESKAKSAGAAAHDGMDRKIAKLKSRRKAVKKSLAKLKRAGGKAWLDLKTGVDKGIEDLRTALNEPAKDAPRQ
jgi:chorismate mutase